MAMKHSKLGASSASRWMACPGSVRLSKGMPNESSKYALEGTAAHTLAERCLKKNSPAEQFLGQEIKAGGIAFTVDDEMVEAVQVYLDIINDDRQPGDVVAIEQRFNIANFHPEFFGTNDCSIYRPSTGELKVYDFKYGQGIAVEARQNPQLLYYGLGAAVAKKDRKLTSVELIVVQPRCRHSEGPVRRWTTDALALLEWSSELVTAAKATEKEDAHLKAGSHCKFCRAAPKCPQLRQHALETAQADFNEAGEPVPVEPKEIDPVDLSKMLQELPIIESWIKRVREYAYHEAEAGRVPQGFKLVSKRANRNWRNLRKTEGFFREQGLSDEEIFQPQKLKTPPQIERLLKKRKEPKIDFSSLIIRKSSGTTLVAESDPRKPVKSSAEQDFSSTQ
ncbi:DUF2800 domain-containing protein [Magnetococcales bacterium HHB-1]